MCFVAERADGSVAGYAMAVMDDRGDVLLERLHIDPGEFGTGLAADLLHAVLAAHAQPQAEPLGVTATGALAKATLSATWLCLGS